MQKFFLLLVATLSMCGVSFSQVKITKTTQQKTFAGMGGVFMNYLIEIEKKSADSLIVDSLITIADASEVKFNFNKALKKMGPTVYQISFGYALSKPEKCKTCPDVIPNQQNLTKGVIIYGRKGEKKFVLRVKKFKLLPDLRTP